METLFQLILIISVLKFTCKATFFESLWGILGYAVFVGIIAFAIYPIVIRQSGDFYLTMLTDQALVSDVAIIITVEAIVGLLVSIGMLKELFSPKKSIARWLKIVPGLLIVGAVFYAEQRMFYIFAGETFIKIASLTAIVVFGVVFGVALAIKYILPQPTMRYELKFLTNIMLLIAGVLLNSGVSSYNIAAYQVAFDWVKMLVFLCILLGIGGLGFALYHFAFRNKKIQKIQKWI